MFKLPLLQPHLTGPNGIESRSGSHNSSFQPFDARQPLTLPLNLETKDWQAQAREVTAELNNSERYKSLAIHAEVKFHEALEKCLKVSPLGYTTSGEERPNKLRTAVCCQLLGEFAEMCGPLSGVLRSLRDELVRSVYSTYCVSERGLMSFDQLPWFTVAERLEAEKAVFLAEQEQFKAMLAEQQQAVLMIEEQLEAFKQAMQGAQQEAAALKTRLDTLVTSEELARQEAKTGREELKRLRKDSYKLKEELDAERAGHSDTAARLLKAEAAIRDGLAEATARLQEAEEAAKNAWQEAERRLPPEVVEDTRNQLEAASRNLADSNRKIRELELVRDKLGAKMESMTPRPSWRNFKKWGIEPRDRTHDTLVAVSERLSSYQGEMDELAGYVAMMYDVLAPDPPPREVQLSVVTDSSNYFITEGGEQSTSEPTTFAEPLGTGPNVPRCLRTRDRVDLQALSLADTELMVVSIWKAKADYDTIRTPQSLQEFLYHFFAAAASAAATATNRDAVRPTNGAAASTPILPTAAAMAAAASDVRYTPNTPVGRQGRSFHTHGEVVRRSYSLYYALENHSSSSPTLSLFRSTLFGQLSEAVHWDQQAMVSGLCRAVEKLAALAPCVPPEPGIGPCISLQQLTTLFEHYFPQRPSFRVSRLVEAVADMVGGSPSQGRANTTDTTTATTSPQSTSAASLNSIIPIAKLLSVLRPRGLVLSGSSGTPNVAMVQAMSAGGATPVDDAPGDRDPSAPSRLEAEEEEYAFVSLLLEQHLHEVTILVEQVSASLDEVPSSGGGPGGAGAAAARAVAGKGGSSPLWPPAPRGAPLENLITVLGEHVGVSDMSVIVGQAFGLPHGPAVNELRSLNIIIPPAEFRRRLLARSIIKPVGNFDVYGTLKWCDEFEETSGFASEGGLPEMS